MPGLLGWNNEAIKGLLGNFTTGISRLPYRSLGAPVDLATGLLRPMGYDVEKPVMGSDWLIDQGVKAGIAREPTGSVAEVAGDVIGGFLDPNPGPEAALAMKAAGLLGDPATQGLLHSIIAPSVVRGLPYSGKLPEAPDFQAAVANTPGAQITGDGLLIKVARKQAPHVEGEQAIRTGVFYLPAGDKRIKYYGGKGGYGGSEKFEGETLFKNPLFVKGATGGKAPENAYDQLAGKGAYEVMRDDVLKSLPRYGVRSLQERADAIRPVIEKYGGDPSMAEVIAAASTEGNTLPYAIQEHIVAHAVRNAGYDGVIGFSKAKDGPFISEIFDVRELTYPSDVISPQIHDRFSGEL